MKIYKVILKPTDPAMGKWPKIEMYFQNHPTNKQIMEYLSAKIDPDVIHDDMPYVQWFMDRVQLYPIGDGESYRFWRPFPPKKGESLQREEGVTTIHELTVTEN